MSTKNIKTIKPTGFKTDKLGRKIAVFRGSIRSTNKYDRKSPKELEREAAMGNPDYKPKD